MRKSVGIQNHGKTTPTIKKHINGKICADKMWSLKNALSIGMQFATLELDRD